MNKKSFKSIQITLASPKRIREWSYGEVSKAETINYRSQKPENDGLFCERIFGPSKDWECHCGKYKKLRYKGVVCDRCGVEVTKASVRRERMGHIELAAPVAHIWYLRGIPSRMALLLDLTPKHLEEVVYFMSMVITKVNTEVLEAKNMDYKSSLVYKSIISPSEYTALREKFGRDSFEAQTGAEAILTLLNDVDLQAEYNKIKVDLETAQSDKAKKLIKRLSTVDAFIKSKNHPSWMILNALPVIPPDLRPMLQLDGGRFATSDLNDLYRRVITRNRRLKKYLDDEHTPILIIRNEKRMLQDAVDALIDNGRRSKPVTGAGGRALKSLSHALKGKQGRFRQNLLGKRVDFSGRSVIAVGPDLKMYECGIPREMAVHLFKPFIINELVNRDKEDKITHRVAEKMIDNLDPRVWPAVESVIRVYPVLLNRAPTLHRLGIQAFKPKLVEGRAIRLHPLVTPAFNADFDGDQMAVHVPLSEEARAEAMVLMLGSNNILGPKDGKPIVTPSQDMVLGNFYLTMEETMEEMLNNALRFKAKKAFELESMVTTFALNEYRVFASVEDIKLAYEMKEVHLHTRIGVLASGLAKDFKAQAKGKKYLLTTVGKVIFNSIFPKDFPFINEISDDNFKETPSKYFVSIDEIYQRQLKNKEIYQQRLDYLEKNPDTLEFFLDDKKVVPAFKKKDLGLVISHVFARYGTKITSFILDEIKNLGFKYSTVAGITVSIADIEVAKNKDEEIRLGKTKADKLNKLRSKGALTPQEWERFFQVAWDETKSNLSKNIMSNLSRKNPINMMAVSGARGSASNFTQLCGMRGLMAKPAQSKSSKEYQLSIVEVPIYSCFREGLNVSEFFTSTHGVRKGLTDTALKTAESGYLTRRLVDVAQDVVIREEDCGCEEGFIVSKIYNAEDDKVIETLQNRLIGRYIKQDVVHPVTKELIITSDEFINEEIAEKIIEAGKLTEEEKDFITKIILQAKEKENKDKDLTYILSKVNIHTISKDELSQIYFAFHKDSTPMFDLILDKVALHHISIRSAFTCKSKYGICRKCYGRNMATGKVVEVGEAIGIMAAQSIGEPGTQLTMRTFHTGGVASAGGGDITQGLPRVEELFEARSPKTAAVLASISGEITAIERQKDGYNEHIYISNGEEEVVHKINGSQTKRNSIVVGTLVEAGDCLTEGQISPKELLEVAGVIRVQEYILEEVLRVYNAQGIELSDKHIEVMIRQMLRKVLVVDAKETELNSGTQVSTMQFSKAVDKAVSEGKEVPIMRPILLGISKSSVETDSFLSAASFQETTKVLTEAAIYGRVDHLIGLKENVIVGNLIPAGTGYPVERETSDLINEKAQQLREIREAKQVKPKNDELRFILGDKVDEF